MAPSFGGLPAPKKTRVEKFKIHVPSASRFCFSLSWLFKEINVKEKREREIERKESMVPYYEYIVHNEPSPQTGGTHTGLSISTDLLGSSPFMFCF